jgi:hypothetical protein
MPGLIGYRRRECSGEFTPTSLYRNDQYDGGAKSPLHLYTIVFLRRLSPADAAPKAQRQVVLT